MALSYLNTPATKGSIHNPFRTYSNFIYPRTIQDVFTWALWFWERNAKYRNAISKVVSYFVSSITVTQDDANTEDTDTDAITNFEDLLVDDYSILPLIVQFGEQLAAMGNVFISAERIFTRQLLCPTEGCDWIMALHRLRNKQDYKWNGKEFVGECPQCHKQVVFKIKDSPSTDSDGRKIRFVFRDAMDMYPQYNRLTGTYKYFYKLPDSIKSAIKRGDSVYLEDTPKVFLEAATTDGFIEFPEETFLAMRTDTLSEFDKLYKGWGLPLFMSSFDNFLRLQHLDKFNEAVTMDYIAPTRMISPKPQTLSAGIDDPNRRPISGAQFKTFMTESLKRVKENPSTWVISPFPVDYTMLGGEAKQLAPVDLMEWYVSQILSDMGIPAEFRQTSFQQVGPTMGMRMFERQWIHFAKKLNKFTKWVTAIIADAHQIENMSASLDVTSFVEDDMNKQVQIQMMQAGVIAKTNILKRIGIDFEDDISLRMREQKLEQDAALKAQSEQQGAEMIQSVIPPAGSVGIGQAQMNIDETQARAQQAMQQGMPPEAAGGPMPPDAAGAPAMPQGSPMSFNTGASQSASIEQMNQEAQQMAQQMYTMPQYQRTQQLVQLKQQDPNMHALVKQILSDMKQDVASHAVAQSQQPQG